MNGDRKVIHKTVNAGVTFGACLAMVISFTTWQSVLWAVFHGALSWIYVIYYVVNYGRLF